MTSRTVTLNIIGDASGGNRALDAFATKADGTAKKAGLGFSKFLGPLNQTGVLGPFSGALSGIGEMLGHVADRGMSLTGKIAGIGVGLAGLGVMGQQIGSHDKEAQQQLRVAIEATGHSYDEYERSIEKSVKRQEHFGTTAKGTYDALRILTQGTQSEEKAASMMALATDLAAAKHISLEEAAQKLVKVYSGKGARVLAEFGISATKAGSNVKGLAKIQHEAELSGTQLSKAQESLAMLHERLAGKTKLTVGEHQQLKIATEKVTDASHKNALAQAALAKAHLVATSAGDAQTKNLDALAGRLKGQGAAAADSFSGKLRALKAEVEDGAAKLGQKYGPALTGVGAGMGILGMAGQGAKSVMGLFTGATQAATVATEGLTVATEGEAVAEGIALGPILLIIAAIALLAFGVYELVKHWKGAWEGISTAVHVSVDFVKRIIGDVIGWIGDHWQVILAILTGPFGIAVKVIHDHFDGIVGFVTSLPGKIVRGLESLGKGLAYPFLWAFNEIARLWNATVGHLSFHLPSWIPGIGGKGFDMPQLGLITGLQAGGIVTGPMIAAFEGNQHEAVIPLDRAAEFGFGGGDGGSVVVEVPVYLDSTKIAHVVTPKVRTNMIRTRRNVATLGLG